MSYKSRNANRWIMTTIALVIVFALIFGLMTDWYKDFNKYCWFGHTIEEGQDTCSKCGKEIKNEDEEDHENEEKDNDVDNQPATMPDYPSSSNMPMIGFISMPMLVSDGDDQIATYASSSLTGVGSNYLDFTDDSATTGRLYFSSKSVWMDGAVGTIEVTFVAPGSNYTTPSYNFVDDGWAYDYVIDLVDLYEAGYLEANLEYTVRIDFYEVYENDNGDYEDLNSYSCYTSDKVSIVAYGLPDAPTKTGYTFTGWYKDAACTRPYEDDVVIGDVTLYAGFEAHTYTIKFNSNGGTGSMSNMYMTYDVSKSLTSNNFTRTGYTFKGWATSAGGSVVYTNGESVENLTAVDNGSVTLYAVWEEHDYTIKFDSNGGSGTMTDMSMKYSQTANLIANVFTKTGYTFKGWATSADGSVDKADKASVSKLTATDGATITYYAVWEANTYTIKFDSNGGSGSMSDIVMTYDQSKTLPANTFTYKGSHFVKWAINGGYNYLADGATANNLTSTANGTVTLKAVWETNTYNVKFHANGGSGTMADMTGIVYDIDTPLTKNSFTREHYVFLGWATSADGSVVYRDGEELYAAAEQHNETINLYAVWQLNEKLVTFVADGNTVQSGYVVIGEAASIPTAPAKTGYNFMGWFLADGTEYIGQEITDTTTITAKYEIIRCNITFIVDGKVYAYAQVDYGTSIKDAIAVAGINELLYEGDENF